MHNLFLAKSARGRLCHTGFRNMRHAVKGFKRIYYKRILKGIV